MLPYLLGLHIAGGTVALLSGPVPVLSRKGSWLHRRAGDFYAAAMLVTNAAGFVLAVAAGNTLLLGIAVLSFFLVYNGVRAIGFARGGARHAGDSIVCAATALFGIGLLWTGAASWQAVPLCFGAGSLVLAYRQHRLLRAATPDWIAAHLTWMLAAYISTVSAFLVVNLTWAPPAAVFLGPACVGTPVIVWLAARRRRQAA
jgi:hypothetical protein